MPRMKLYLNFERALTAAETDGLRELVKRRGTREPLQHITGSTSFCGCEIAVSRQALVPRPETEMLAELGWSFLKERETQHAGSETGAPAALDFGTGTGCIAIALAVKCPSAQITALDVSAEALALARQNAELNKVAGQIEFLQGDGFAGLPDKAAFDLIVSNPPYIASAEIGTLQPEVRDFDPRTALDGGADGLDFYRRLAREAAARLKPDGKIMVEFGDGQAEAIKKIFEGEKWIVETVKEDYSHRSRILVARRL
jgi:release factor glutamine methyltransferase